MKDTKRPMSYRFPLSGGREWGIDLPMPLNEMPKKDKVKFVKFAQKVIKSIEEKSRIEARATYEFHLSEAQRIKEDWNL